MNLRPLRILNWGLFLALFGASGFAGCSTPAPGAPLQGSEQPAAGQGGSGGNGGEQPVAGSGNGVGGSIGVNIDAGAAPCVNLECRQTTCSFGPCSVPACAPGLTTTVSGVVYEPAGKIPLYNAMVYVPNGPVAPFEAGVSCDRCDLGALNPVVSALTDTEGRFVLEDVPVGSDIPLVIQIGKWRRQLVLPNVAACTETTTDPLLTRLPRNKAEGDIPLIAITTGGADSMECLPRRLGIDDAEFTTETGDGRIHLYSGQAGPNTDNMGNPVDVPTAAFAATLNAGAALTRSTVLWSDVNRLKNYDVVILSCEGGTVAEEKPMPARQAMYEYASAGGRVLASHWHHIWFSAGPAPVPEVGTWTDRTEPDDPATGVIDQSFPKGEALAQWLVHVGASPVAGEIQINAPRDNVQAVDPAYARQWITTENTNVGPTAAPQAVQYLSFNAPLTVPEEEKCGRAVFTDLHVSSTGGDTPGEPFPSSCADRDLSPEEKAVAFMLFDLSACIQDDDEPPRPPH